MANPKNSNKKPSGSFESQVNSIANLFAGYGIAGVIAFYFLFHYLPQQEERYKSQIQQMNKEYSQLLELQSKIVMDSKKVAEEHRTYIKNKIDSIDRKTDFYFRSKKQFLRDKDATTSNGKEPSVSTLSGVHEIEVKKNKPMPQKMDAI